MKKFLVLAVLLALAFCLGGCCSNPDAMSQLNAAYNQTQSTLYGLDGNLLPDVSKAINNTQVKEGVILGDTVLMLGGMAQKQYCANQDQAAQMQTAAETVAAKVGTVVPPVQVNPTTP